ncbi:MAG: hypothetical protein ACTSU3_01290 [Candidatus Thorarchaeota archaeon]
MGELDSPLSRGISMDKKWANLPGYNISKCDWCDKPKSEWTNTMRWWGQGKYYCSMGCYSAGEYKVNLYLFTCGLTILGVFCAFVISVFLTDLTIVTIAAILTILVSYLLFFGVSLACIIIGRKKRINANQL